jgi:hypothetical protein
MLQTNLPESLFTTRLNGMAGREDGLLNIPPLKKGARGIYPNREILLTIHVKFNKKQIF